MADSDAIFCSFDLSAFDLTDPKKIIELARIAESGERYDDMCLFMKKLVDIKSADPNTQLLVEERNLLSVAYKNVIGARRTAWRTMTSDIEGNTEASLEDAMVSYQKMIEKELVNICSNILDLLENKLIPQAKQATNEKGEVDHEAHVFYLKMAGDYYRYLAESVPSENNKAQTYNFYKQAFEIAQADLQPTHPIRLGLALNYSVCHYEVMKDKTAACNLAKDAFDAAISKLDQLGERDYKDSTLIMQLLRDNLTLWTANEDEQIEVEDFDK